MERKFIKKYSAQNIIPHTKLNSSKLYFKYSGSDEYHHQQLEKQFAFYKKIIKIYLKYSNAK
jgi:hypothetical protein